MTDKVREALEWIVAQRYADRPTVTPETAFNDFTKLDAKVCEIYSRAAEALASLPAPLSEGDLHRLASDFSRDWPSFGDGGETRMLAAFATTILTRLGQQGWQPIETALRQAFPHFQNDEPVTAESIQAIGKEYTEMVIGWQPMPKEISFVDQDGTERKLVYEEGDEGNSGWCMPEYTDWHVASTPPKP